jgi:hypothetical protein
MLVLNLERDINQTRKRGILRETVETSPLRNSARSARERGQSELSASIITDYQ